MRAALYVHIPFCVKKCVYCDFASYAGRDRDLAHYLRALEREIKAARREFGALTIETLFIGGGTPSLLSGEQVHALMDAVRVDFAFAPDAEITVEANPGAVSLPKLRAYRAAGVNRISLGVQAMQDSLLRTLGRIHTAAQAEEAVELVRRAGYENINLDLMYALPGQTAGDWADTLECALSFNPEHLSCYSLILEPGTPLEAAVRAGEYALPDEETTAMFQAMTVETLKAAGYIRYEISNYAKPGFACRHNLVYWRRGNYLGLGCAAHALMDEVRFANTESLDEYLSGVTRVSSQAIPLEEAREEMLMLSLRMSEGLNLGEYERRFGRNLLAERAAVIGRLSEAGYAVVDGGFLRLTDCGMDVQNAILVELL